MPGMRSPLKTTIVLLLIFGIGMWAVGGKIRYAINPIARHILLKQYLRTVTQDNGIDAEKFWEFRDFYSATTSIFEPEAIAQEKPFLIFKTPYITSYDYLSKDKEVAAMRDDLAFDKLIFQSPNTLIYQTKNSLIITFTLPQKEMMKANGFFKYYDTDLSDYADWHWFNHTTISL